MKGIFFNIERYYTYVCLFLLFIALAVHINNILANLGYGPDNIVQTITANSFMEGHGFSTPYVSISDLSKSKYEPYGKFPPGYSLLLIPILIVTNNEMTISIHITRIIAIILFFVVWCRIFSNLNRYLKLNKFAFPVLISFWIFAYTPFKKMGATDLFALSFFALSFLFLLKIIFNKDIRDRKINYYLIIISLCSFICSFFKYSYYTYTFITPCFIILMGFLGKRKFIRYGIFCLLITSILLTSQIVWQKITFGEANFLSGDGRIFHPENFTNFDPVFSNSFIFEYIFYRTFPNISLRVLSIGLSYFIFILLIYGLVILVMREVRLKRLKDIKENPLILIILFSVIVVICNIAFLSLLSLFYPCVTVNIMQKSWVMVSRHFSLSYLFIQFLFIIIIFNKYYDYKKLYKSLIYALLIISVISNFLFWGWHGKKLQLFNPQEWKDHADHFTIYEKISEGKSNTIIVITETDEYIYRLAMAAGASQIYFTDLIKNNLRTSGPVELLIPVPQNRANSEYFKFCNKNNARKILTLNDIRMDIMSIQLEGSIPAGLD